jgi:YqaJ-like viral recombinase domain
MSWGSKQEETALAAFLDVAGGVVRVRHCAFDVLRGQDPAGRPLHWIGASPDGVLEPVNGTVGDTDAAVVPDPTLKGQTFGDDGISSGTKLKFSLEGNEADGQEGVENMPAMGEPHVTRGDPAQFAALLERMANLTVGPPQEWPHLVIHPNARGILEIKCPYRLCAAAAPRPHLQLPRTDLPCCAQPCACLITARIL